MVMTVYATYVRNIDLGNGSWSQESYNQYGRPGSSILDEFNRLANNGEYPAYTSYLDLQGAINKWTGAAAGTAPLKALNNAVGITDPQQYREFNSVLNYYIETQNEGLEVDTTGPEMQPRNYLEAVVALRLIPA